MSDIEIRGDGSDEQVEGRRFWAVRDATEFAITAAKHLTPIDAGAVAALRVLATKIDSDDALREAYLTVRIADGADPANLKPLQLDNVSVPTYLKYCESLGLTPAGRIKLGDKKEPTGGKLGKLSSVPRPA